VPDYMLSKTCYFDTFMTFFNVSINISSIVVLKSFFCDEINKMGRKEFYLGSLLRAIKTIKSSFVLLYRSVKGCSDPPTYGNR
jgi:hypothetical protein